MKHINKANEQQASAASIASTNAVLATLVHKFSQDFALTTAAFALALALAVLALANYQKFWNKYYADADFNKLVRQSVVWCKRGAYLGLINAEALREFLTPELAAACGEHDVLIQTHETHTGYIWHKIDAQKLAQIVVIAENADELRALLQRAGSKI